MTSHFQDTYKVVENQKTTEQPKNDLNHFKCQKLPLYAEHLPPEAHISLRFALRSLVFQIIEVFSFAIGYNGEIQKS